VRSSFSFRRPPVKEEKKRRGGGKKEGYCPILHSAATPEGKNTAVIKLSRLGRRKRGEKGTSIGNPLPGGKKTSDARMLIRTSVQEEKRTVWMSKRGGGKKEEVRIVDEL